MTKIQTCITESNPKHVKLRIWNSTHEKWGKRGERIKQIFRSVNFGNIIKILLWQTVYGDSQVISAVDMTLLNMQSLKKQRNRTHW